MYEVECFMSLGATGLIILWNYAQRKLQIMLQQARFK